MTCDQVRDELAAFLDGELSPEQGTSVLAHLEGCSGCRDERAVLERTRERVKSLPRVKAPVALLAQVATRLAAAAGRGPCPDLDPHELSAFLDAELAPEARAKVKAHLEACPSCRGDLVALDSVVTGVQNLPRIPAPEILAAIVRERIALLAEAPSSGAGRLGRRPSRAAAAAARSAQPARPDAPAAPRVPREPVHIPLPVQRLLAAACVAVLALVVVPLAAVNGSSRTGFFGSPQGPYAGLQVGPGPRVFRAHEPESKPSLPKPLEHERTLGLLADASLCPTENLDSAVWTVRNALASTGAAVTPTRDPGALIVRGQVAALRRVLEQPPAGLALEDPTSLDVLLPPPLDRVYGRSGEVYAGSLVQQGPAGVVLRAGELTIELPARSCVRVERAGSEPRELGVAVRRRRPSND